MRPDAMEISGFKVSPILPRMKDPEYDYVAVCHLVTNLVLRCEHPPDLSRCEAWQPLSQARLGRNALDATDEKTHRADGCAGIDRLQEIVQPAQIPMS